MSKTDSLLKKAEFFEKLALYGGRKDFLRAIAQEGPLASIPSYQGSTMVGDSGETSTPKSKPDPAVKAMQTKLNKLLVNQGYFFPIFEDGVWGDQTNKALRAFKEHYPASAATPQAVAQATPHPDKETQMATRDPGAPIGPMGKGLGGVGGPTTSQSSGLAGKETPFTPTKTKI